MIGQLRRLGLFKEMGILLGFFISFLVQSRDGGGGGGGTSVLKALGQLSENLS